MSESNFKPKAGVCHCLRTRMMYLPEQEPDPFTYGFTLNDVGRVWCTKTLRVLGPDNGLVDEDKCVASRGCFQGL